jgi:hypothetical protein
MEEVLVKVVSRWGLQGEDRQLHATAENCIGRATVLADSEGRRVAHPWNRMAVKWERKEIQEYGLNSRTVRSCEDRKRFPQQSLFVREGRSYEEK